MFKTLINSKFQITLNICHFTSQYKIICTDKWENGIIQKFLNPDQTMMKCIYIYMFDNQEILDSDISLSSYRQEVQGLLRK